MNQDEHEQSSTEKYDRVLDFETNSSLRGNIYFSTSNVTFKVVACHGVFVFYLELVYFVTALVPSDTACFANSPGSRRRTAVWISLEVMVDLLL